MMITAVLLAPFRLLRDFLCISVCNCKILPYGLVDAVTYASSVASDSEYSENFESYSDDGMSDVSLPRR
jgi:hypothetical protein